MISSLIARVSAAILLLGGIGLLFAPGEAMALLALVDGARMLRGPFDPLDSGTRHSTGG